MSAIIGRPAVLVALLVALAALVAPAGAGAAVNTLTVSSTVDPGNGGCATGGCTLREAITELDDGDTTDQDRINIDFSQNPFDATITLASALPTINEPLSIASTGRFGAVVSGNNAVQVLRILSPTGADVSISGLTIRDGAPIDDSGGGIHVGGADVTISNSNVVANKTLGFIRSGGGIYSVGGTLTIERSTIAGNSTSTEFSNGGGIYAGGPVVIVRSTISGNETNGSGAEGGGVLAGAGGIIESSTITGNHTDGESSHGGGISIRVMPLTIRNSTISGNFTSGATANGGGVYSESLPSEPPLTNSIVANNSATGTGPDLEGDAAYAVAYTLVEDVSGAALTLTVPGSDIFGVDPQLGPLAQNGGATLTHLPAGTSPVIDKGSTDEAADQRSMARPVDYPGVSQSVVAGSDGADIGAVELPAPPAPPGGGSGSGGGGSTPTARPLAFGASTLVTLKLGRKRIGRRGPVFVVVTNRNGFAVTGRLSGRRRGLKLKPKSFSVGADARKTIKLKLSKRLRRLLVRKRKLTLRLAARVKDPSGHARSVKKTVKPKLKRKRKRRKR